MSVTYTRTVPNLATSRAARSVVIERLADLLHHLERFQIRLEALTITWATGTIVVTLSGPVPADQRPTRARSS